MKRYFLVVALALVALQPFAQKKDAEAYKKQSEEIRKQVWNWDKPEFKVRTVPPEFSNNSKVVIAHHIDLSADSKTKIAIIGFGIGGYRALSVNEVVRQLVKLNDQYAVNEYSELSFTSFKKRSGFVMDKKTTVYVGVRIIKPNGSMKEINADDIVLTKDEKTEKKAKLAVPDLQIGDIIDFFIATEQTMQQEQMELQTYNLGMFGDGAPIMSFSFHAQLGKKYAVEHRSYNGAPELTVKKGEDDDIIIDLQQKNISKAEQTLWVAERKQLPHVKINILVGYKGMGSKGLNARKPGEVFKNRDPKEFFEDIGAGLSSMYYNYYWMQAGRAQFEQVVTEAKKIAKRCNIDFKNMNETDKAAFLFYVFRYNRLLSFDNEKLNFLLSADKEGAVMDALSGILQFSIFAVLKSADLKPAILVSSTNKDVLNSQVGSKSDLENVTYLQGTDKYFDFSSIYNPPFVVPSKLEGMKETKSITFDHPAMIMSYNKIMGLSKIDNGPNVPLSTALQNNRTENLTLSLTADKSKLAVQRSTTLKGYYKSDVQRDLIVMEDFHNAERKAFNEEKATILEELESEKKTRKKIEEIKNILAEARKKQKDAFIAEAKDWFELEVTDLTDNAVTNLGVRHTSPDFSYASKFTLDGMVKKGGNNIIIEVGKLQGNPMQVTPEQRKRVLDAYLPFANSKEYNIELQIPEGYTAEGIPSLNKKVENASGMFTVEAVQTGNNVSIKLKKHFLHNYEPVSNWNNLVAILDAASEWSNSKILLKKK